MWFCQPSSIDTSQFSLSHLIPSPPISALHTILIILAQLFSFQMPLHILIILLFINTILIADSCPLSYCTACNQTNSNQCLACLSPFYTVSPQANCTQCLISFCTSCSSTNVCASCQETFILSNNSCMYCNITNCGACGSTMKCSSCNAGYALSNNRCVLVGVCNISKCMVCISNGVCSSCESNYSLYQNQCIECAIQNCLVCNTTNSCISCSKSFLVQNNSCIFCAVANCIQCNSNTSYCESCASGFNLYQGYCNQDCPNNCDTCNIYTGACSQCSAGFTLSSNQCVQCSISNCALCQSTNQCSECSSAFTLNNITNACVCLNAGVNSSTCGCSSSQTLYQNSCISNCGIANCINCSTTCQNCLPNYKLINNSCISFCLISNCQSCATPNVCSACLSGLVPSLDGSLCVVCNISNCAYCSSDNSCGLCQPGYSQDSSSMCVPCSIEYCEYCPLSNICQYCFFPFAPSVDSLSCLICLFPCTYCNSNGSCVQCNQPYSLVPDSNGACFLCSDPNCQICSPNTINICEACLQNFQNINGVCYGGCQVSNCKACDINNASICISCNSFYALTMLSQCEACFNNNCIQCSPSNTTVCLQCKSQFYLSGTQCYPCPIYCYACTSATQCSTTIYSFGYSLVTANSISVLALCDSGCLNCMANNPSRCYQCLLGYYLANSSSGYTYCTLCSNNCQICDSSSCSNCFPNFYMFNGSCLGCSSGCLTCSGATDNCTSCQFGYTLSSNKCFSSWDSLCDQNCAACFQSNGLFTCQTCGIGFVLQDQNCLPCISGCGFCSSSMVDYCLICSPSFYLSEGACYMCDYNCVSCLSAYVCLVCSPGYILTSHLYCINQCTFPCSTCQQSLPSVCLSCVAGYYYDSGTSSCLANINCNTDGGCVACPSATVFSFISETNQSCLSCSASLTNCLRCLPQNISSCVSCVTGYYLDGSGVCNHCPFNCSTCYNYNYCILCSKTYVAMRNVIAPSYMRDPGYFSGFYYEPVICIKCFSPCRTCYYQPSFCTSCLIKYYLFNNFCVSNFNYLATISFSPTSKVFFMANYYSCILILANTANVFINQTLVVSISQPSNTTIELKIIISTLYVPATQLAVTQQRNLTTLLQSGFIGQLPISSYELLLNGGSNSETYSNRVGIIIAGCIAGIFILAVVGVIVVKKVRQRKGEVYKQARINETIYDSSVKKSIQMINLSELK